MSDKIRITVDGREVEADNRTMLLEILTELGIAIPTLCHHPSLAPSGSCRLCLVEITKESWNGNTKIVTACLYPAEEGLIVSTRSDAVLKTRRSLLELYLAQCPGSEEVKALARLEGIDTTPFTLEDEENKCVLCGLCTRVCQDCGPGAIATMERGIDKFVGPNPDGIGQDCTGCRACAYVCPTGAIPVKQENQILTIWNRQFEIPICEVDSDLCRGCGICEEVCPFSIPRVTLQKGGLTTAKISPTTCVGCGICAGSCPSGAIRQKKIKELTDFDKAIFNKDLTGKTVLFACPRSPLPHDQADLVKVSCIGSVDISTILYCIAAGASGVALMCRDKLSCPYSSGGDLGEKRLKAARELLTLCGLQEERLTLLQPFPGQDGPHKIWLEYKQTLGVLPEVVEPLYSAKAAFDPGMDLALAVVDQIKNHPGLQPLVPETFTALFDEPADQNYSLLYLGNLPELHLLFSLLMAEPVILKIMEETAKLLKEKNIPVRCIYTENELEKAGARMVISFAADLPRTNHSVKNSITLNEIAGQASPRYKESFLFAIDSALRRKMIEKHLKMKERLNCSTVEEFLQYALLLRPGAWQLTLTERPGLLFASESRTASEREQQQPVIHRIENHPILPPLKKAETKFTFNGTTLTAREGEVITSALYAAGIYIFGHHQRDGGAQGIYCVNGQCSQCMVIADGKPVKGCMTPVTPGMTVTSVEGLPELLDIPPAETVIPAPFELETDVLIIGGGPAGISAAIELGNVGVEVLLIDDKQDLGGKLSLQTHNFFGSVAECYAGYRGVHIGEILAEKLKRLSTVTTWLNSTVTGVYSDCKFGVSQDGAYKLVKPKRVLFSTGAREKSLVFPGADLPGVYGAGAFQTLVNRDLVRCAERLFIIGGGNVGLIGAYHALQAGIDVVGLVEALPKCGGYKVHEDKIRRLGVPVWTSHTVLRIEGQEKAERIIIAAVDQNFRPISGTERVFDVDTVLIAVGLSPVNELLKKAKEYGLATYAAGDAEEIAEASAAIFSGKIIGRRIAQDMGIDLPIPSDWEEFGETLKHHAGESDPFIAEDISAVPVYPLIRCMQEIPCNPCIEACPNSCISMPGSILSLPEFGGECIGCGQCVLACPGLAINLVVNDYDPMKEKALLMLPYEFVNEIIPLGREVTTTDMEGNVVGKGKVIAYKDRQIQNSRRLLLLEVPHADKLLVAGFKIRETDQGRPIEALIDEGEETDPIVCRCERVKKSEIVQAIRAGVRDMNQLKALVRAGLGGCNGKTCTDLILRIYREEGIDLSEITMPTHRPLVAEVHLGDFIALENRRSNNADQ
jgi:sarcosine oxidase, subunit alpha